MKKIFDQLIATVLTKIPTTQIQFNSPATENELLELESLIGKKLPEDFVQFYSIANGNAETSARLFNGLRLLSISEIIFHWQSNKEMLESDVYKNTQAEADAAMKTDWWNINWLPITDNMSGDHLILDLAPTSFGTYGQIFNYWHDPSYRALEATSFENFILQTQTEIENGTLRHDVNYNGFIKF